MITRNLKTNLQTTIVTLSAIFVLHSAKAQTSAKLTLIRQDFELARTEAKKQHKMLLIDFYTTWCIP